VLSSRSAGRTGTFTTPELKAAWRQGRKELFYPYGKTYAQTLVNRIRKDLVIGCLTASRKERLRQTAGRRSRKRIAVENIATTPVTPNVVCL